jgi:hypothetical protein
MEGRDWEAALARPDANCAPDDPPMLPPHAHATAAEAAAWEAALGGVGGGSAGAPPCVAAVECGSHSTRLLLVEVEGRRDVARLTEDTALGLDASAVESSSSGGSPDSGGSSGLQGPQKQDGGAGLPAGSTLRVLREYAAALRRHDGAVRAARAVGTAALRAAAPGAAGRFLQQAEAVLGCPVEILSGAARLKTGGGSTWFSGAWRARPALAAAKCQPLLSTVHFAGEEEAALAFAGAASSLPTGQRCLLVDLGGLSTEVACGETYGDGCIRRADAPFRAPEIQGQPPGPFNAVKFSHALVSSPTRACRRGGRFAAGLGRLHASRVPRHSEGSGQHRRLAGGCRRGERPPCPGSQGTGRGGLQRRPALQPLLLLQCLAPSAA